MMDSGAADRIVNGFLALLGEKRGATALCATATYCRFRSSSTRSSICWSPGPLDVRRTNRNYLKYLLAIAAGAGATHTLVPPTRGRWRSPARWCGPRNHGPGRHRGGLPAAGAGLLFAGWVDRRMPVVPEPPPARPSAPVPQRRRLRSHFRPRSVTPADHPARCSSFRRTRWSSL